MIQRFVDKLRAYLGHDREERETAIAPSQKAESRLPGLHVQPNFAECSYCQEKILVEVILFGVSHNAGFVVHHKKCLKARGLDKDYAKEHPEDAALVQKWLDEE